MVQQIFPTRSGSNWQTPKKNGFDSSILSGWWIFLTANFTVWNGC
jgi:hypothetical protein